MLEENASAVSNDYWALGVILYQMVTGTEPFKGNVESEVFRNILERKLVLPMHVDSDAADLIDRLLTLDPTMRIGCGKGENGI
jgi:serine/threonine protein kinase